MNSPSEPPPGATVEVDHLTDHKVRSFHDPEGVSYIDHLDQILEDVKQPLDIVFRTDTAVFDDVPVNVWWSYGTVHNGSVESDLWFELPDEVVRRVQQAYAAEVQQRWFGLREPGRLPRAFRRKDFYDETRQLPCSALLGQDKTHIVPHWETFCSAVRTMAENEKLQDKQPRLHGMNTATPVIRVRVQDNQLQLYLDPHFVRFLRRDWAWSFKAEALLED